MKIHICTLFENSYHLGVAGLVNSLHAHGYSGTVHAGYRGELPSWAKGSKAVVSKSSGKEMYRLRISEKLDMEFIPLDTTNHLTNHKPDFMISLFEDSARDAESLIYMDPDIVVNENWAYFQDCAESDVVLSEDLNSPISLNHPRRQGWRAAYQKHGFQLNFRHLEYVNGGFIACRNECQEFLEIWKSLQDTMFSFIGGGNKAGIAGGENLQGFTGYADCFGKTDQDALNAAVESYSGEVSILGREAMGFRQGHTIIPHAIGQRKPWATSYLKDCCFGITPRFVDKLFWKNAAGPIAAFPSAVLKYKQFSIRVAGLIGRFYRKS